MKSFIAFALFVAAAAALPLDNSKEAVIKSYSFDAAHPVDNSKEDVVKSYAFDNIGVEGYKYAYETSHGTSVAESAVLKNVGSDIEGLEVTGEYSYYAPDGTLYKVAYVANEKGFQPQGSHISKA